MINMDKVRFSYHLAELWSDFLDFHEQQPPHLGGVTSATEDELHEPTMLEFMDWLVDQVEQLEPQIAALENGDTEEYCRCPPGFPALSYEHVHNPKPREN